MQCYSIPQRRHYPLVNIVAVRHYSPGNFVIATIFPSDSIPCDTSPAANKRGCASAFAHALSVYVRCSDMRYYRLELTYCTMNLVPRLSDGRECRGTRTYAWRLRVLFLRSVSGRGSIVHLIQTRTPWYKLSLRACSRQLYALTSVRVAAANYHFRNTLTTDREIY